MLTFTEALESLCVIPERIHGDNDEPERVQFTKPQMEFSGDILAHQPVKILADMCVQTVIQLFVSQGLPPDLMPVGRECYLNGLILGVAIGVRMEKAE